MSDLERPRDERAWGTGEGDDIEQASENVLDGWPATSVDEPAEEPEPLEPVAEVAEDEAAVEPEPGEEPEPAADLALPEPAPAEPAPAEPVEPAEAAEPAEPAETSAEHAPGELEIPPGYPVLEGEPRGGRRAVGVVVSRFNGEVTGRLLDSALAELEERGVDAGSVTVMPVPGAFELPLAAMALAKTRRFACVVALGCVIRGDTPHFDYVASEAASGLQLAAIETGVPVSFGVLTLDRPDQAEPRYDKGAEAVRTALEMADLFSNLRAAAAR
jgi:6,7-dimethyl-8-ribityllumazine synthase